MNNTIYFILVSCTLNKGVGLEHRGDRHIKLMEFQLWTFCVSGCYSHHSLLSECSKAPLVEAPHGVPLSSNVTMVSSIILNSSAITYHFVRSGSITLDLAEVICAAEISSWKWIGNVIININQGVVNPPIMHASIIIISFFF